MALIVFDSFLLPRKNIDLNFLIGEVIIDLNKRPSTEIQLISSLPDIYGCEYQLKTLLFEILSLSICSSFDYESSITIQFNMLKVVISYRGVPLDILHLKETVKKCNAVSYVSKLFDQNKLYIRLRSGRNYLRYVEIDISELII